MNPLIPTFISRNIQGASAPQLMDLQAIQPTGQTPLPLLEPTLLGPPQPLPQSAAAEGSNSSRSSSEGIHDDIHDFIEDSHASKTVDELLEEIRDPGSSPFAYALLAILLFKKAGKLKDPILAPLIQKVRQLIPGLIQDKQTLLAFDLWTRALNKIAFQKLEDLKNPKEAPCTGSLLKALLQDDSNADLDKRFDTSLTLYNQLLSLKPAIDRVLLGKLLTLFAPRIRHFLLHVSDEQRKDKIERVIRLLQETFQRVDLPVQMEMSTQFAATCVAPELFRIALAQLCQAQAREKESGGIVGPGLRLLINQFILISLHDPESDSHHYWEELFHRFTPVKEGEQALFDASLIQRMTPRRYLQLEKEFHAYPLERFLSFFKEFTLHVSPQPVSASASSSASSSCPNTMVEGAEIEGALVRGLEHINGASIASRQKKERISEFFTEALLSQFPALKFLCEKVMKKPSDRDLVNGLGELFPELAEQLNALKPNTDPYYSELKSILLHFLEEQLPDQLSLHLDKIHALFNAEEKKQLASRPSGNDQWLQNYSKLISLHLNLLSISPAHFKNAISILEKSLQNNLILIEDFKTTFLALYRGSFKGKEDQNSLLLAICTESNLTATQLFFSQLIPLRVMILNALNSKRLDELDSLAEELEKFHKKQKGYSADIKIDCIQFSERLKKHYPFITLEPAAKKLCQALNRLTQSTILFTPSDYLGASSSTSDHSIDSSSKTMRKALSIVNLAPLNALELLLTECKTHANNYMLIHLCAKTSVSLLPKLLSSDLSFTDLFKPICKIVEDARVRLKEEILTLNHKETLQKRQSELALLSEQLVQIYMQLGSAYYAKDTIESFKEGLSLLALLQENYPDSTEFHQCLVPHFSCAPTRKKAVKVEKTFSILLSLALAHFDLKHSEECILHTKEFISRTDKAWTDQRIAHSKANAKYLASNYQNLKQWGKALYHLNFLKTQENDPAILATIDKQIESAQCMKQLAEKKAMSDFPQFDESNPDAFETLSDLMIHYSHLSTYDAFFYSQNLCAHLHRNRSVDMPKDEFPILAWITEGIIKNLLAKGKSVLVNKLYIAFIDYFEPNEIPYNHVSEDLPLIILEALITEDPKESLLPSLQLMIKLILKDHPKSKQFITVALPIYDHFLVNTPRHLSLWVDQFHQVFIEEESRLLELVRLGFVWQYPENEISSLFTLLFLHYQTLLISTFKEASLPSLERACDLLNAISEILSSISAEDIPFNVATLRGGFEVSKELTRQLALFKESKTPATLSQTLQALRELHHLCPKNRLLQNVLYIRTLEVTVEIYSTMQAAAFPPPQEQALLEDIASEFIDLFKDEETLIWIDCKADNQDQLITLIKVVQTYISKGNEAPSPYPLSKSLNGAHRLVGLIERRSQPQPAINPSTLQSDNSLLPQNSPLKRPLIQMHTNFNKALKKSAESETYHGKNQLINIKKRIELLTEAKLCIELCLADLTLIREGVNTLIAAAPDMRERLMEFTRRIDLHFEKSYLELGHLFKKITSLLLHKSCRTTFGTPIPVMPEMVVIYQEGAQRFKNALKVRPDSEAALIGLGICLLSSFIPNGAVEAHQLLGNVNSQNPDLIKLKIETLYQVKAYQKFIQTFENTQKHPDFFNLSTYASLGDAAFMINANEQSLHYYEQMYIQADTLEDMIDAQKAITSARARIKLERIDAQQGSAAAAAANGSS